MGNSSWLRRVALALLGLLVMAALFLVYLDTAPGHRFVAERIAALQIKSGLRITVGRIDGSIYNRMTARNITLADPQGKFLTVPQADLDWRPLRWFQSGLDIRRLVLSGGAMQRLPRLRPGDPDAPILPDFDIRIDDLKVENLTIAEGVLGAARQISLNGKADIRKGRALVRLDSKLGGTDQMFALIEAEPARNRFDVKLDVNAPKGGLLAGLTKLPAGLRLNIAGKGSWRNWQGALQAEQDGKRLAALQLTNREGRYGLQGLVWPDGLLGGMASRAAGASIAVAASGTLVNNVLGGEGSFQGEGIALQARGAADLASNRFDAVQIEAQLRDSDALISGTQLEGVRLSATLEGPFRDLSAAHKLTVTRLVSGKIAIETLSQTGTARYDGTRWTLPLDASAARVVTGVASLDPRLFTVQTKGVITLTGSSLASDNLALSMPGITANLALRGDTAQGGYALAGPVAVRSLEQSNLGSADADGRIIVKFGKAPWAVSAQLAGRLVRVDNATLTSLAGTGLRFGGKLSLGKGQPLLVEQAMLNGSKLSLNLAGRIVPGGGSQLSGRGTHADYGPFSLDATIASNGPSALLTFADPMPSLGLKAVRVALAPIAGGFNVTTSGSSRLGPFSGAFGLFAKPGGPTRIDLRQFEVWKTRISGALTLTKGLASGSLALAGGGIDGRLALAPQNGGQGFTIALKAQDARFVGDMPLTLASAQLNAQGMLRKGYNTISGNFMGQGIGQGRLFIGKMAASAQLTDGIGQVTASLAGQRGARFDLQLRADVAPQRVAVAAQGQFANQRISLPRRAVWTAEHGGWRLAPTQLDFAGGRVVADGQFGSKGTKFQLALANTQLAIADVLYPDLGLGGRISGLVNFQQAPRGAPSGEFKLKIAGLTRSSVSLTSRPIDLALVGSLLPNRIEARAIASEGGTVRGRFQGRISGLAVQGALVDRINQGALFGQLRYDGPADALWRLAALESFDLTGPLAVAADIGGTVAAPSIRGSLAGTGLQLQSALTGMQINGMAARGSFAGSRLVLSSLSGQTAGGGSVSGSGSFDFSGLGTRGPAIDLRIAARNARLLARDDMSASVTGPLLIRSDGSGGVIAGRLAINRAGWQLGRVAAAEQLPTVRTRETGRPADRAAPRAAGLPWRFLIDAKAAGAVDVRGMGLDSEWSADVQLRGSSAATVINGRADLVRGGYEFAGKRFELARGRIIFDGGSPPDPRLDIVAEDRESGLTARIAVTGTSLKPEIAFSSIPALPEEELLSRILFGTSITNISAPEALQLGAAIASLQSGGGLDPINKLRRAIGLDRLRIVSADVSTGRGTGLAAGKNISRRLYAEVITDGRGYSATQLEFRVTNWLSLLSAISTIGRESINAKVSKDY